MIQQCKGQRRYAVERLSIRLYSAHAMNNRFQVFVSSTYSDLIRERERVIKTLLSMRCFPSGMESFPAQSDEAWSVIKEEIDSSDFYVLIIAGRYGSTTSEGLSYTEKEFDYAVSLGIPVLVFPHIDPDTIPVGKSDIAPSLRKRLDAFRTKALTGRTVKHWSTAEDLGTQVALALQRAIDKYGAKEQPPSVTTKKHTSSRSEHLTVLSPPVSYPEVSVAGKCGVPGRFGIGRDECVWSTRITLDRIFAIVASCLPNPVPASEVKLNLVAELFNICSNKKFEFACLDTPEKRDLYKAQGVLMKVQHQWLMNDIKRLSGEHHGDAVRNDPKALSGLADIASTDFELVKDFCIKNGLIEVEFTQDRLGTIELWRMTEKGNTEAARIGSAKEAV
jgi:hypothetical protein